nr:contractile injection system protein, VgrG/Pvc8 family [Pseudomonas mosselii]
MSLQLTDNRGLEADQLDLTLSDHDGLLVIPPRGAVVRLWLGWSDTGLVDKGSYIVDETEHSGAPDVLSIRARSADLRKGLKIKRERSWSATTLGEVLGDIAQGNGLTATISGALDGLAIPQLDQANESDANLLTRLGEDFDAVATMKAGCLVCMPAGGGKTASGLDLPTSRLPAPTATNTGSCRPTATAMTVCGPTTTTSTAPRNRRPLPAVARTSRTCAIPTATGSLPCAPPGRS